MAGDIDAEAASKYRLRLWQSSAIGETREFKIGDVKSQISYEMDSTVNCDFGQGVSRKDKYFSVESKFILGGGFQSRLYKEERKVV